MTAPVTEVPFEGQGNVASRGIGTGAVVHGWTPGVNDDVLPGGRRGSTRPNASVAVLAAALLVAVTMIPRCMRTVQAEATDDTAGRLGDDLAHGLQPQLAD